MRSKDIEEQGYFGTRLVLENENGRYSIEIKKEMITISEFFDELVVPILLAAGYSEKLIQDYYSV